MDKSEQKLKSSRLLRLLSYNIQVGIQTRHFGDYIIASWKHLLPNHKRLQNLHWISQQLKPFDLVALQEVDGGSLRSSYINQVEYLANHAGFPYWYHHCNRNLGKIAQHSNGLLAKLPVSKIINHKLPGLIPGRGAIEAILGNVTGETEQQLKVIAVHLALSNRARKQQINFLAEIVRGFPYVIIMGDWNCSEDELLEQFASRGVVLKTSSDPKHPTFPSWQPIHHYDHIFVTPKIEIVSQTVLPSPISDHLPVVLEVLLPDSILGNDTGADLNHYHPVRMSNNLIHNHLGRTAV